MNSTIIGFITVAGLLWALLVIGVLSGFRALKEIDCTCDSDYEDFNERPCADCD